MDFPLASLRFLERKRRPRARAPRVSWHSSSKSNNNITNNVDDGDENDDHDHDHDHEPDHNCMLISIMLL